MIPAILLASLSSADAADGKVGRTVGAAGLGVVAGSAVVAVYGGITDTPEVWMPAVGALHLGYGMAAGGALGAATALRRGGAALPIWPAHAAVALGCVGVAVEVAALALARPDDPWFVLPALTVHLAVLPASAALANVQLDRVRDVTVAPLVLRGGAGLALVVPGRR